ncbi:hypothetical protein N4G69_09785 [Streptomyces mirabilis]|uniref:hypothetical protein n=1 Tax=Streptomyces mirabilis TaxID=68239 RepID=UPI0021C10110|nr:hypothetical protein [Streptomyces mirabilis]MCT9105914.1 hypothetical protein [Streptomyces mirabilis]
MGAGRGQVKRGHVYELSFAGSPAHALVMSTSRSAPPPPGTVVLGEFRTLSAPRFTKELGPVDERVMEAVEIGLRAVFDL